MEFFRLLSKIPGQEPPTLSKRAAPFVTFFSRRLHGTVYFKVESRLSLKFHKLVSKRPGTDHKMVDFDVKLAFSFQFS